MIDQEHKLLSSRDYARRRLAAALTPVSHMQRVPYSVRAIPFRVTTTDVELARRAADTQPTAAVLLLTGTDAMGSERRDAVEGFHCLYKTASPQEVLTRIAAMLADSKQSSVSA